MPRTALVKETTMTTTMKAIRVHEYGSPDVLKYEDAPRPEPGEGEILIRTHAAMVGAAFGTLPVALTETVTLPRSSYALAYLAIYGALTFAGYTLYNIALSKLPTTLVAISGYGQPVIATALAMVLLGEIPSLTSFAGGAVVVGGLLIATINRDRTKA